MRVAVIGAGTMGAGIAQVCATAGHDTQLADIEPGQLARAITAIRESLDRLVAKGRIHSDEADAAITRLDTTTSVEVAVGDADVVIETVVEVIDIKHNVLRLVVAAAPGTALIGTNTSQLPITRIAAAVPAAADRVVGLHFFNPPVLMRLVEIIKGLATTEPTIERAIDFARTLGKDTVVCRKDSPGFLVSRISAIVRLECLRMLEEGVATASDIDKSLRLGLNFPIGPLELGDMNGLDTYLHIVESLEDSFGERFKPTVTLRNLVAAGHLGRKTGQGIYRYDAEGKREADI